MTLFGGVDSHSLNKLILRVAVRRYVKYTLFQWIKELKNNQFIMSYQLIHVLVDTCIS